MMCRWKKWAIFETSMREKSEFEMECVCYVHAVAWRAHARMHACYAVLCIQSYAGVDDVPLENKVGASECVCVMT